DGAVPADGAAGEVEGEQLVVGAGGQEGDGVERVRRRVDDGGTGDARGIDVAARQAAAVHRRSKLGPPGLRTGGGVEGVHRVAFGRRDHGATDGQRLGVDVAVERRRLPHLVDLADLP